MKSIGSKNEPPIVDLGKRVASFNRLVENIAVFCWPEVKTSWAETVLLGTDGSAASMNTVLCLWGLVGSGSSRQ